MQIFRAVKTNYLTQGYGKENTAGWSMQAYKNMGMIGHDGFDWYAPKGEKILWDCSIRGTVENHHLDTNGGLGVSVITEELVGGIKKYHRHIFWHVSAFKCKVGQVLESGDLIALVGDTGYCSGPHLHRAMKELVLTDGNIYVSKNTDNGYRGWIDMTPYFENIYIDDELRMLNEKVGILTKIVELLKNVKKNQTAFNL